jgi:hypothetical protein
MNYGAINERTNSLAQRKVEPTRRNEQKLIKFPFNYRRYVPSQQTTTATATTTVVREIRRV